MLFRSLLEGTEEDDSRVINNRYTVQFYEIKGVENKNQYEYSHYANVVIMDKKFQNCSDKVLNLFYVWTK